jgi:hypothetical protein
LLPPDQDFGEIDERRELLCQRFVVKYGSETGPANALKSLSTSVLPKVLTDEANEDSGKSGFNEVVIPEGLEHATEMRPDLEKLFDECLEGREFPNPVLDLISRIERSLSLDALIAALEEVRNPSLLVESNKL